MKYIRLVLTITLLIVLAYIGLTGCTIDIQDDLILYQDAVFKDAENYQSM